MNLIDKYNALMQIDLELLYLLRRHYEGCTNGRENFKCISNCSVNPTYICCIQCENFKDYLVDDKTGCNCNSLMSIVSNWRETTSKEVYPNERPNR